MATFPAALASLPRPTARTKRNAPGFEGHALQNQLADEIEAIQAAIGVSGSAVSGTVEKRLTDTQQAAAAAAASVAAAIDQHAALPSPHSGALTPTALSDALAGAFQFQIGVNEALAETVVPVTATTAFARDLPFAGWAARYAPAGAQFNAIKLHSISRSAALQSSRWATLHMMVRTGVNAHLAGKQILAQATLSVPPTASTLTDVIFVLRDPNTLAVRTITDADISGGEYFIAVWALGESGAFASCGEPRGAMPNALPVARYYYMDSSGADVAAGAWVASTDPSITLGFAHLLVDLPAAQTYTYSAPTQALATAVRTYALPEEVVVMPPYIYAVEGRECNVYLDNLHMGAAVDYDHDVITSTAVGKHQAERFTWTPGGAQTSGTITVDVYRRGLGIKLSSSVAQLRSAAAGAGSGITRRLLMIGDSLVANGTQTQTLLDISAGDVFHLETIGTQGSGAAKHEGRSGWSINQFVTSGSPFYISGAVNFSAYLANNALPTPDWVTIALGINDFFALTSDSAAEALAATEMVKLDLLIASIKAAGPAIKVGVVLPTPPSASQDAFAESYQAGQCRWRFKRNIVIWAAKLIAKYAGQEAARIYIVPSNVALDTVNNMSVGASAPANSRSLVSIVRQNNGVHPATQGYQQMADMLFAFLKHYANA